jgi:catechol 2,3-dioxygenase-like lactoylglutathione lyase family enzyme
MLSNYEVCAYAPVRDIERGRRFYEGVLRQRPVDQNEGGVLYECANGSKFFMYRSDGAGTSKASTLFWNVPDVEKEVAELKSRGVVFEHYDGMEGMTMKGDVAVADRTKAAWFKDPDGNILALIEVIA